MVALLVFIIATLEIAFGRKKLLDAKGPSGDNVIKKRSRYSTHPMNGMPGNISLLINAFSN